MSVETVVKVLSNYTGRDKLNRFLQYLTKFLVSYGQSHQFSKDTLAKLTALAAVMGQTRKTMRLGRFVEFFSTAIKSVTVKDEILRVTGIVKSIGFGLWLVFDGLQWSHGVGVYKLQPEALQTVVRKGNQFWLVGLVASLLSNGYKVSVSGIKLSQELKVLKSSAKRGAKGEESEATVQKRVSEIKKERQALVMSAVQDALDVTLPGSALDLIPLDATIVSVFGTLTSLMGLLTVIKNIK